MGSPHFCYDAILLGKTVLHGPLNAKALAHVVTCLQAEVEGGKDTLEERKCNIECSDKSLSVTSSKKDEGFESDSDSTKSNDVSVGKGGGGGDLNSVSDHVIIHDHVLKFGDGDDTSSANSSGSETDDTENNQLVGKPPLRVELQDTSREETRDIYSVNDILFCHTDALFPKIVVWVIRVDGGCRLEAVVFECNSEDSAKELCRKFHEISRKCRSEKYKHTRKRSDSSVILSKQTGIYKQCATPDKNFFSTTTCSLVNMAGEKSEHVQSETVNSETKTDVRVAGQDAERPVRWSLLQHTDKNGVTHIEVESSEPCSLVSLQSDDTEWSSIISINTPDVGDVIVRSGAAASREMRGVIVSEAESRKEHQTRQRQQRNEEEEAKRKQKLEEERKQQEDDDRSRRIWARRSIERREKTAERPERGRSTGRYVHNKGPAPPPPPRKHPTNPNLLLVPTKSGIEDRHSIYPKESHVVRGRFIRVSVGLHDHPPPPSTTHHQPHSLSCSRVQWRYPDLGDLNNNTSPGPGAPWTSAAEMHHVGRAREPTVTPEVRRRSRSKSPARRPMSYKYTDAVSSPRLTGISQKFREFSDAILSKKSRNAAVERSGHSLAGRPVSAGSQGSANSDPASENPGSGILKNRKKSLDNSERRVTFSVYSVVQMID